MEALEALENHYGLSNFSNGQKMNPLDLPLEIIHLIFQSIPDQWGLYSLSSLQDPNSDPNPRILSLDLWQ